ncbi:PHD finger protein EHD3 isoform X2 [Magnolia sinica]|uniref:PHD finger protein EHD3 isoform X2 n=1 Tax=Magnolia sinica TaxID=86752 RepID=UPI002659A3A3|nr:PHD finger protein EHD3 isoform X2 [Magnolia sinica]
MPVVERTSNGSTSNCSPEKTEAFITYKRRKHAMLCADGNLHGDGGFGTVAGRVSEKTTKEPHDMVLRNNGNNEEVVLPRVEFPIPAECTNGSVRGHWKNVLEHILQLPDVNEGGIRSCICDALASSHFGFTRKFKMHAIKQTAQPKEPIYQNGDMHKCLSESTSEAQISDNSGNAAKVHEQVISDGSQKATNDGTHVHAVTEQCRSVFLDVIVSDEFFLLCNFLCGNFQGIKADHIFDFGTINSRMKNGQYEHSSELLASDIQQVWKKFEKIGEEMVRIAKSLSSISQASYLKREISQVGNDQRDSVDADSSKQCPSFELDLYTKPEQTEASGLQKSCTCRQCGAAEADGERRLVCDSCEAMYHITCINPPLEEVPPQLWYCAACLENGKQSPEPDLTHNPGDGLHQNCVVCERLKDSGTQKFRGGNDMETTAISDDSEETSDGSSTEANRQLQLSRGSASLRLCKVCKIGEEDGLKFMICEHEHCPYKYYHTRCLRSKQMACPHSRWYCPSCLCRSCLFDRDDDKIVLCDGCDEAYHIYCMVPPLMSIPKGNWYCIFCTIEIRARQRMRLKCDEAGAKKQKKGNARRGNEAAGSVDMLLCAAEKLSSEEKPAAPATRRKNR